MVVAQIRFGCRLALRSLCLHRIKRIQCMNGRNLWNSQNSLGEHMFCLILIKQFAQCLPRCKRHYYHMYLQLDIRMTLFSSGTKFTDRRLQNKLYFHSILFLSFPSTSKINLEFHNDYAVQALTSLINLLCIPKLAVMVL